jgi:hypothetical protein
MASRIIRCPDTGEWERIDYQADPLGLLIDGCSRGCPLECRRTCASELDREARRCLADASVEVPGTRIIEVRSLMR